MTQKHLDWIAIIRLGLVQSAIGSIVVITNSTLNRVMVVELALAASLPAALVAWHYAIQLSRPIWGHGSDVGRRRTPWIVGGMGLLVIGALFATNATIWMATNPVGGTLLGILAFAMIGAGVGASGTSLLALLATEVAPSRRPAAAAITWIMMIVGIVITAGVIGQWLDPFSPQRLALVVSCVAGTAFLVTLLAVNGVESGIAKPPPSSEPGEQQAFVSVLKQTLNDPLARHFTIFVFVSMLAYSAQDLILEPFAGLVFGFTVGESTQLAGVQHGGVLLGMILVGLAGSFVSGDKTAWLVRGTIFGCAASAAALVFLMAAAYRPATWPLEATVFGLGFANGVFAVSAIGLMMSFAGKGASGKEGVRMGVWGASQAIAFGVGGFAGAAGLDVMRHLMEAPSGAFAAVFAAEACFFIGAAVLALRYRKPQIRGSLSRPHTPVQSTPNAIPLGVQHGTANNL